MNSFWRQSTASGARLGKTEMLPADRDDFFIGRMIVRLHPKRDLRPRRLQVAHQSRLLGSRSEDQDIVAGFDCLGDRCKKLLILLDMTCTDRAGMMV